MSRLSNARIGHLAKWVVPAAARLLLEGAREGAPTLPLSQVAHVEMGQSPEAASLNNHGEGVPFVGGPADMGLKYPQATRWTTAPTKLCESGDIIICVRATIGEPRSADGVYCLGRGVAAIRPVSPEVDARFLFRVIEGSDSYLRALGTGTTFKTISKPDIAGIRVPTFSISKQRAIAAFLDWLENGAGEHPDFGRAPHLPEEVEPIGRIVARIEELAAKIEEARGLRQHASAETDMLLSAEASRAYHRALCAAGGTARLEDLCVTITDGTHVTPRYVEEGIPFLSVKNITSGEIRFDNARFITPEEHAVLTKRCRPELGDVLLTKVGTTGFAKAVDVEREFSIFVSLALLKLDRSKLDPKYAEHMLNSPRLREFSTAGTRGVGNQNLVLKFIRDFPMPAPPIGEQLRIVAWLDNINRKVRELKDSQAQVATELDALLPSVLDKAFEGRL